MNGPLNFILEIPFKKKIEPKKKFTKKLKSPPNLNEKSFKPQKKIIKEFFWNLIWVNFTGKSFVFFYKRIPCTILQGNLL